MRVRPLDQPFRSVGQHQGASPLSRLPDEPPAPIPASTEQRERQQCEQRVLWCVRRRGCCFRSGEIERLLGLQAVRFRHKRELVRAFGKAILRQREFVGRGGVRLHLFAIDDVADRWHHTRLRLHGHLHQVTGAQGDYARGIRDLGRERRHLERRLDHVRGVCGVELGPQCVELRGVQLRRVEVDRALVTAATGSQRLTVKQECHA